MPVFGLHSIVMGNNDNFSGPTAAADIFRLISGVRNECCTIMRFPCEAYHPSLDRQYLIITTAEVKRTFGAGSSANNALFAGRVWAASVISGAVAAAPGQQESRCS